MCFASLFGTHGEDRRIGHYKSLHVWDKLNPRRQRAEFVSFQWATLSLIINAGLFAFFCLSTGMQNKSVNSNDLSAFGLVESGSPAFVRPMWQNLLNCRARLWGWIKRFSQINRCIFIFSFFPLGSCRSQGWRGTSRSSWSSGKFSAVWESTYLAKKKKKMLLSSLHWTCLFVVFNIWFVLLTAV